MPHVGQCSDADSQRRLQKSRIQLNLKPNTFKSILCFQSIIGWQIIYVASSTSLSSRQRGPPPPPRSARRRASLGAGESIILDNRPLGRTTRQPTTATTKIGSLRWIIGLDVVVERWNWVASFPKSILSVFPLRVGDIYSY